MPCSGWRWNESWFAVALWWGVATPLAVARTLPAYSATTCQTRLSGRRQRHPEDRSGIFLLPAARKAFLLRIASKFEHATIVGIICKVERGTVCVFQAAAASVQVTWLALLEGILGPECGWLKCFRYRQMVQDHAIESIGIFCKGLQLLNAVVPAGHNLRKHVHLTYQHPTDINIWLILHTLLKAMIS